MSYTTLAASFGKNGSLTPFREFRNGWGSAPFIWDKLVERYRVQKKLGDIEDLGGWKSLWEFHREGGITEPWEVNALLTTYDRMVVKREDMLTVSKSLREFERVYRTESNRVCSLSAQADAIEEAYKKGARFIAWTQTSVSDNWWHGYDENDKEVLYRPDTDNDHFVAEVLPLGT